LAVKATKAEALYDRPSDFKGVDDQTAIDQQKSTCHVPADERPSNALRKLCAELGANQHPST